LQATVCFRSYLTPIALRHNTLSSCKETGTSSTYDIGNSDNSSERLCTVPTKYYHNNVTTSITIPYNITHSKQSSAVVLQNAQKSLLKLEDVKKRNLSLNLSHKTLAKGEREVRRKDLLPPIHETLTSFR
uniref:Uncharacterized protein n=1 Tax=Brugia timori TaxID=42155 RepID=A0A0R3Q6L0_9BILA